MNLKVEEYYLRKLKKIHEMKKGVLFNKSRDKAIIRFLDEVKDVNAKGLIKYLIEFVFEKNDEIVQEALKCIREKMETVYLKDWLQLSENIRRGDEYHHNSLRTNWFHLKVDTIKKMDRSNYLDKRIWVLVGFHPNGYIREYALNKLDEYEAGEDILYFLLHANDWVTEVSNIAVQSLKKRMNEQNMNYIIKNLPLVEHLGLYVRRNLKPLAGEIISFVKVNENANMFITMVHTSKEKETRRICYRLLGELGTISTDKHIELGFRSKDTLIQRYAINEMFKIINRENAEYFYDQLKCSRSVGLRKFAPELTELCEGINKIEEWEIFLTDGSHTIRENSRFYLRHYQNGIQSYS